MLVGSGVASAEKNHQDLRGRAEECRMGCLQSEADRMNVPCKIIRRVASGD